MRIVVASDSFKGSLSSIEIANIIEAVVTRQAPSAKVITLPMADGGEGTIDALVRATGGMRRCSRVTGPLGETLEAAWGLLPDGTAVIEMAAASGLPLVAEELRNPLHTSTRGTGELVRAALDAGASSVMLTIGGSATNDGGMGALSALGAAFVDDRGERLVGTGADLARVAHVDVSGLDARLSQGAVAMSVLCDVDNPLLGSDGAAATFAPQKGADDAIVDELERGMASYARVVTSTLGLDHDAAVSVPGGGAAGGLGFALASFFGAAMVSGIEAVLDAISFDEYLATADLVITGEGRLDAQTAHGKVISGVARRCQAAGVSCVAIVGSIAPGTDAHSLGLADVVTTTPTGMPLAMAMERASELYAAAVLRLLTNWCG